MTDVKSDAIGKGAGWVKPNGLSATITSTKDIKAGEKVRLWIADSTYFVEGSNRPNKYILVFADE